MSDRNIEALAQTSTHNIPITAISKSQTPRPNGYFSHFAFGITNIDSYQNQRRHFFRNRH
jgi:hypothetical protein